MNTLPNAENSVSTDALETLNVAATCSATQALGPGFRSVVWVQGCPFQCPGCLAPDWIPFSPARFVTPQALAQELLRDERVTGITFSGGEPMMQANALARVAHLIKRRRDCSVICFSGFTLDRLQTHPPNVGVANLLAITDVLIDGQYIEAMNSNRGLRGSENQGIHFLTDRLIDCNFDFEQGPRRLEVHVSSESVLTVGVPPHGAVSALDGVARQVYEPQI